MSPYKLNSLRLHIAHEANTEQCDLGIKDDYFWRLNLFYDEYHSVTFNCFHDMTTYHFDN